MQSTGVLMIIFATSIGTFFMGLTAPRFLEKSTKEELEQYKKEMRAQKAQKVCAIKDGKDEQKPSVEDRPNSPHEIEGDTKTRHQS